MKEITAGFGWIIGFLLPGFVAEWGASNFLEPLKGWFKIAEGSDSSTAIVVFLLLGAVALGVVVSAVRWATVEPLYRFLPKVGYKKPKLDFGRLDTDTKRATLELANENFYKFYLFYGNMSVAVAFAYGAWVWRGGGRSNTQGILALTAIELILLVGGRDSFKKYYDSAGEVIGVPDERGPA